MSVFSFLFLAQVCFGATYTPPTDTTPGSLQFDNIVVDLGNDGSAVFTATDNAPIHAGQVYVTDLDQYGSPSGDGDAGYSTVTEQLSTINVSETRGVSEGGLSSFQPSSLDGIETSRVNHDLVLQFTDSDLAMPNLLNFTVVELNSVLTSSDAGPPTVLQTPPLGGPGSPLNLSVDPSLDIRIVFSVLLEDWNPNSLFSRKKFYSGSVQCPSSHSNILFGFLALGVDVSKRVTYATDITRGENLVPQTIIAICST